METTCTEIFRFRSCELVTLSTGLSARSLSELAAGIRSAPTGSLHYHFWGRLIRPQFGEFEYRNDFASWVETSLHDRALAEELSVINPSDYPNLEELREDLLYLIEHRLDREDFLNWSRAERPFFFTRAQMLVFDTGQTASDLTELTRALSWVERSSIFYHFIDARRRTPDHTDDLCCWLGQFGEETARLRKDLAHLEPYLLSLEQLREDILKILNPGAAEEVTA